MNNITDIDLAYAAGFIDGEGYVAVYWYDGFKPCLRVVVTNTNLSVLIWFKKTFGGAICVDIKKKNRLIGRLPCHQWRLYGKKAEVFLMKINHLLKIKKVKRFTAYPPRPKNEFDTVSKLNI